MATDRIQLQALRSKDVLSGSTANLEVAKYFDGKCSPKLPTKDQLEFGEIALNIAKGYEVIAIKNYDGEIVYLPFNVASKLLDQKVTLDELKEYAHTSIDKLKEDTKNLFDSVEAFRAEVNEKIDKSIQGVLDELSPQISGLSATTSSEIAELAKELREEIKKAISDNEALNDLIEERINAKIKALSAETISLIESTSGETNQKIDTVKSDLSKRIDDLANDTKLKTDALSGKTDELDEKIISTKDDLESKVEQSSLATDFKINSLRKETGNKIAGLKTTLEEKIDKVEADTSTKIDENVASLNDKISKVESESVSRDNAINKRIDDLSSQTNGKIEELGNTVDDIRNDFTTSDEAIRKEIEGLSGKTDEHINNVYTYINAEDEKLKAEILKASSGYTDSEIGKLKSSTEKDLSDAVSGLDTKIGKAKSDALTQSEQYTDSEIDKVSENLKTTTGSLAVDIDKLRTETDSRIKGLKLNDLSDVDTTKEVGDGIEIISKSGDTWVNSTIGRASGDKEGLVRIGEGLESKDGVVSVIPIVVDDKVTADSKNPVSSKAVYGEIDGINTKLGGVNTTIGDLDKDLKQIIIDDEEVAAGYAVRMNYSLGFDENAIYVPTTPSLKNKNVTEAIDAIYNKIGNDVYNSSESVKTEIWKEVNDAINALSSDTKSKLDAFEEYLYSDQTMHFERTVTYESLVKLVKQSKLRWGVLYRLTNYQATVNSSLTKASTRLEVVESEPNTNNGFDILLRATSNSTLNENCMFMKSVNGDYFRDSVVECWQGKYSLFNDRTRFEWADPNGFGVIYYMKDNFENEAHYDFKNIVFGNDRHFTFNLSDAERDASLTGEAKCNVIAACYDKYNRLRLNNVTFKSNNAVGNIVVANTKDLTFTGEQVNNFIGMLSINLDAGTW